MSLVAPAGPVYQAGTLSGNPLAVTAGPVVDRPAHARRSIARSIGLTKRLGRRSARRRGKARRAAAGEPRRLDDHAVLHRDAGHRLRRTARQSDTARFGPLPPGDAGARHLPAGVAVRGVVPVGRRTPSATSTAPSRRRAPPSPSKRALEGARRTHAPPPPYSLVLHCYVLLVTCSLSPVPCSPVPCSLVPSSDVLPTCDLFPVPCSLFPVPVPVLLLSRPVPCSLFPVLVPLFLPARTACPTGRRIMICGARGARSAAGRSRGPAALAVWAASLAAPARAARARRTTAEPVCIRRSTSPITSTTKRRSPRCERRCRRPRPIRRRTARSPP